MAPHTIRSLMLPNKEHPYGDNLQESLARYGVTPLECDAGWGFELHRNLEVIRGLAPDILHLQWPESLCRAQESEDLDKLDEDIGMAFDEIRRMRIPVVWTMHNLRPHILVDLGFQTRLYERFAALADGVIHHSHCGKRSVLGTYAFRESTRHAIIRHGYFTKGTECDLSRSEAREKTGLPARTGIYLFCGAFRKDKNIDILVEAFGEHGPDPANILVMVGQEREAASALYPDCPMDYPNILWPGRLSFEELSIYVKASDALVTAHGDKHLTSAGPHLSQSYLKPQVCLSSDYNREVLGDSGFYFDMGVNAAENLRTRVASITPEMLEDAARKLAERRDEYRWDGIGRKTKVFYEEILDAV